MPAPTEIVEGVRSYFNDTGATITARALVIVTDTGDRTIGLPAAATSPILGVAMHDIGDDEWGDIQIRGVAKCNAHGALATKGVRLMPTTAGRVDTQTGTNSVAGILLTEASAQDDIVLVELTGPGNYAA